MPTNERPQEIEEKLANTKCSRPCSEKVVKKTAGSVYSYFVLKVRLQQFALRLYYANADEIVILEIWHPQSKQKHMHECH